MSDGTAPRGDADLNWLQMRASETARVASELLAEAQRLVALPLGDPEREAIMPLFAELSAAQKVALESQQALEDAYAA